MSWVVSSSLDGEGGNKKSFVEKEVCAGLQHWLPVVGLVLKKGCVDASCGTGVVVTPDWCMASCPGRLGRCHEWSPFALAGQPPHGVLSIPGFALLC